jgi:hypothetical protein
MPQQKSLVIHQADVLFKENLVFLFLLQFEDAGLLPLGCGHQAWVLYDRRNGAYDWIYPLVAALARHCRVGYLCFHLELLYLLLSEPEVPICDIRWLNILPVGPISVRRQVKYLLLKFTETHELLKSCNMPFLKVSVLLELLEVEGLYKNEIDTLYHVLNSRHSYYHFVIFLVIS